MRSNISKTTCRNGNLGHASLSLETRQMAIKSLQLSPYPSFPTVKVTVTMHSLPNGTCTFQKNGCHASFLFFFLLIFFNLFILSFSVLAAYPPVSPWVKEGNALYKMHFSPSFSCYFISFPLVPLYLQDCHVDIRQSKMYKSRQISIFIHNFL